MSREPVLCPHFAELLSLWSQGVSIDGFGRYLCYITISLHLTLDVSFVYRSPFSGATMIVESDKRQPDGLYVYREGDGIKHVSAYEIGFQP